MDGSPTHGLDVAAIAACDRNLIIGNGPDLPWHIPEDLRFFKETTAGHPIVMGRKTWETLPKALPKRLNVVITRRPNYQAEGAVVVATIEEAFAACAERRQEWGTRVFVVGGGEIYRLALPYTDTLYITRIQMDAKGDVTFPQWSQSEFNLIHEESADTSPPLVWQTWQRHQ